MGWTSDHVDLAVRLWREGETASYIAAKLGFCTRNAVLGKLHRLGVAGRNFPRRVTARAKLPKRKPPERRFVIANIRRAGKTPVSCAAAPAECAPARDPAGQPYVITNIKAGRCRFIARDPRESHWCFCANPVEGDAAYCPHHARLCYMGRPSRGDNVSRARGAAQ